MSQVLNFRRVEKPAPLRLQVVPRGDEVDAFWPEVYCGSPAGEEAVPDPANSPKQVLSEVLALFAGVAVLVAAVTLFIPGP